MYFKVQYSLNHRYHMHLISLMVSYTVHTIAGEGHILIVGEIID